MMVEGEATQEPSAPDGAPASPPAEDPPSGNATASTPQDTETAQTEAAQAVDEAPQAVHEAPQAVHEAPVEAASPSVDWSHVRGFQSVEAAPEGLAAQADYAEELSKELGVRAARFARSVDESVVLSSDGLMRWLGDPVARVVAGDEVLQPRAVLLADDALTGENRGAVEGRAALWLTAHVRKVLGPLFGLAEGSDLPEAARALGGKTVEALGVLERDRVRDDVRALDQTARGALRKLGVRFGALYIYVPILLKPGPRALCTMLWTLKRGTETGADRLLAFAAAGRTSFANEGLLSPDAYRVAGFRLCGERVVRVDIIERLSDLIRAAIPDHMRAGSRAPLPTYGFPVTPQMTSLTGCSGEAFASILRSLGFEAVKVGKAAFEVARAKAPTEPLKPAIGGGEPTPPPAEPALDGDAEMRTEDGAASEAPSQDAPLGAEPPEGGEPEMVEPAVEASAAATTAEESAAADRDADASRLEPPTAEFSPTETGATTAGLESPAATADIDAAPSPPAEEGVAVSEPAPTPEEEIEIWRPAPRRARAARPAHVGEREAPAHRGKPQRRHGRAAETAPETAAARPEPPQRADRTERRGETPQRFEAKEEGRDDRRPQKGFGPRRESRPVQVDPDSPFAKLAALKPLLERRDKRP